MNRSPEEIKKGLKCCVAKVKGLTVKDCDVDCTYFHEGVFCKNMLHGDAIRIIQQLESRLAQAERERDAAVMDLENVIELSAIVNLDCEFCKHMDRPTCEECGWEWRGVCQANTKEESIND